MSTSTSRTKRGDRLAKLFRGKPQAYAGGESLSAPGSERFSMTEGFVPAEEKVTYPAQRGDREPTHPGKIIHSNRLALVDRPSLRVMSKAIGVSHTYLDKVEKGVFPVTAEIDLLVTRYFGMEAAGLLLRMQIDYDLWHAQKKLAKRLKEIVPAERD